MGIANIMDINLTLSADDADADTLTAINIDYTGVDSDDADLIYGINIGNVTTADAQVVETAIRIGEDWQNALEVEGDTNDAVETYLTFVDPTTSDKTITFPKATGTVAVSASSPLSLSVLGDLSCSTCLTSGSGGTFDLTLAGTSGSNQTISDGDTITIAAGTGITTTGGTTDTVTVAATLGTAINSPHITPY